ncbi:MAG: BlaI/MecI/CopY family transcriptional regulator [Planctomycetaceae bacterium]
MTRKKLPPLSRAQLEIMNVVWDRGETTVGEIFEILSARRPIARNTIQTTMVRLEEKGWLKHRQVANAFRYSSTVPREQTLGKMASELVDKAFGGSLEGLVMTLIEERGLTAGEADRIRKMIDESESKGS